MPLETTDELTRRLEDLLLEAEGVEGVYARVGRARGAERAAGEAAGLHTAALEVRLAGDAPATSEVVERFREAVAGAGIDPGALAVTTGRSTSLGRTLDPGGADLAVKVKGGELDELAAVAESARARLAGLDRLADVRVDFERAQPRLEVEVLRDEVARHGLSVREVADAVEAFLRGLEAERPYTEFDDRITIRVSLPDTVRRDLADVLRATVGGVPVERLVQVRRGFGPVEVRREGQTRTVEVLADVSGGLGRAVAAVRDRLEGLPTPGLVRLEVGGENEEMRDSFRSLLFAFGLALFLVYLILSAQFESVVRPAVVLAAVPLAAVGAVLALWAAGAGVDVMSGIGVVILVGIVVNDAIIKVDFIEQRRRQGLGKRSALMEAGRLRLRPIVMTTVTTVLGLTPLALGWGAGADLRAPLAVAVIGGLLSATLLTLLVVPVIYSVVVDPAVPVAEPAAGGPDGGAGGSPDPGGRRAT
jgi:HAE1 family hydrophobic/amphiphilic exporter-1